MKLAVTVKFNIFSLKKKFSNISLIDDLCSKLLNHMCTPDGNWLTHSCL